uniref:Secreted protein n=1 Tax=Eutreptiella gymnastica TaxID=73025 RepID=A0A7S4FLV0_9EUGL
MWHLQFCSRATSPVHFCALCLAILQTEVARHTLGRILGLQHPQTRLSPSLVVPMDCNTIAHQINTHEVDIRKSRYCKFSHPLALCNLPPVLGRLLSTLFFH